MTDLSIAEVERLIAEDAPAGDLTTDALGIGAQPGFLTFAARGPLTLAGVEIAADILSRCGASPRVLRPSGSRVAAGERVLEAEGPAAALHKGWKVAVTLVETMSGVASAARALVDAVDSVDPRVRVACTRKTIPGARRLSQLAIQAGGAIVHRHGISETLLVFAQHRVFCPNAPLRDLAERLRRAAPEKKAVIEATTPEEAAEAVAAGFDAIQLDKMKPDAVAQVVRQARAARPAPLVLAAGGINPGNAGAYAAAGVDVVVTSWPYTAQPADIAAVLGPAERIS